MDNYEKDIITFKVNAENYTNKVLNNLVPKLNEVFKDYVGLKVLKTDETLLKEIKTKTDIIINKTEKDFTTKDINTGIYLSCSKYSITIEIKLRFNNERKGGFIYYDKSKYLINIDLNLMGNSNKIKELYEFKKIEEINLNEQIKISENCFNLLENLKKEKEKLKPYSLNDLIK